MAAGKSNSFVESVRAAADMCYKIIRLYDWLLDLYVVDFFVENHWDRLPLSWRHSLKQMNPQILGEILGGQPSKKLVIPLSLMALLKSVEALNFPRKPVNLFQSKEGMLLFNDDPKLKNLFLKHVKLKKRHEISLMADVVSKTALHTKCNAVIDFGSGIGHLVRVLAYKYNLHTAGIERQHVLTNEARKLDSELECTISKFISVTEMALFKRPLHYNLNLTSHEQLLNLDMPTNMADYGLIGLHPCGDLGPLLLKHFVKHENVKFICVVGCCYMKLTETGYPLSKHVKQLNNTLSYVAREISCHAIEVYCDKLRRGDYEDLKVHAFRAALERILQQHDQKLSHAPVRSIKHTHQMNFQKYCSLALERIDPNISVTGDVLSRGLSDVSRWQRVVALYSLRLALAPIVETAILLDRMLYVLENGLWCEIHPVFDPKISARNHIIIAKRL